jgi:hypothetical protein
MVESHAHVARKAGVEADRPIGIFSHFKSILVLEQHDKEIVSHGVDVPLAVLSRRTRFLIMRG